MNNGMRLSGGGGGCLHHNNGVNETNIEIERALDDAIGLDLYIELKQKMK